jgi:hypothetical protein
MLTISNEIKSMQHALSEERKKTLIEKILVYILKIRL